MGDGKVFVRECPSCHKLCQTADQTGKSPCDECAAKGDRSEARASAKKPQASPEAK